ncbi:MAG TPA: hypothetical protein VJ927_03155 [Actinomycetota bacterium]|nr:hypothetical protein [Actinomycetota bacterium]
MAFLAKLLLGSGTFKPEVRAALESDGIVTIEEGLPGSVRYRRFKAPGKRFYGKVTLERLALGISEQRLSVYCRSGRVKLIDSPFSEPRLSAVEVSLFDDETISLRIDYDRVDVPEVSGEIEIRAKTPNAAAIMEQLRARSNP